MSREPSAAAVNRKAACAILDDDTVVQFVRMYDRLGAETDDFSEAASAIAELPDGKWIAIDLTCFEPAPVH